MDHWDERGIIKPEFKIREKLTFVELTREGVKTHFEIFKGKNGNWVALPMFGDLDYNLFKKPIKNRISKQEMLKKLKQEYGADIRFILN